MARLRYNGLTAELGASLTSSGTSITFAAALTHSGGTAVPTISGGDYIPLSILDSTGKVSEIVSLTAYTSGATTGTVTRGQESTTGVSHSSGDVVVHSATVADFAATAGTGDASWTAPSLISSWVNFGAPYANAGYRKDGQGVVHLQGLVKSGTTGTNIFVLPVGYRPATDQLQNNNTIIIRANGEVANNGGTLTAFSLEGVTFYAA